MNSTSPTANIPQGIRGFRRLLSFIGPGFLVAVGYMDPGNWATDLAAGSGYGYTLLWVILLANVVAILFQHLCVRLAVATGKDLAETCRDRYPPAVRRFLWISAQLAIVAMDLAELLGSAIALQLLFGIPLLWGAVITALDVLLLLALERLGMRWLESLVLTLILTIAGCLTYELLLAKPDLAAVAGGFVPTAQLLSDPGMLFIALGLLGATVMPHNLYLHSALLRPRAQGDNAMRRESIRFGTFDCTAALGFAFFVNAGLLVLSATLFHAPGQPPVGDIREASQLLEGALGTALASTLFAVALLASGQNSTITGTLAGQIVTEGFLGFRANSWHVRLATRLLALVPAIAVIALAGEGSVGDLLLWSQLILSLQLGFACWPLVRATADVSLMGELVAPRWISTLGWIATSGIVVANSWLIISYKLGYQ